MPETSVKPWFQLTVQEAFDALKSRRSGLTEEEARAQRLQCGPNELQRKKKTSPVIAFLKQFMSPLVYVLLAAGIVTLAVREYLDAGVIFVVLLANAVIGYIQEARAEAAMEALLQMAAPQAKVRRGGTVCLIPAKDIVPGDVIILESGDKVPADALLIEVSELKVNESVLTGESMAADKHTSPLREDVPLAERKNMVHMGTIVSFGRGRGRGHRHRHVHRDGKDRPGHQGSEGREDAAPEEHRAAEQVPGGDTARRLRAAGGGGAAAGARVRWISSSSPWRRRSRPYRRACRR